MGGTTAAFATSTTNGVKSCTYNKCYVWKQNLACTTGNQRLNGCCAAAADCAHGGCGFKDKCENYAYPSTNAWGNSSEYCLTYATSYKMEQTSESADDIADDKLQVDKVYVYTPCEGGSVPDKNDNKGTADNAPSQAAAVASGL